MAKSDDKIISFEEKEVVKERSFDHDPRRHFEARKQAMQEKLIAKLIAEGCLKEETKPTGYKNEFEITLTLRALK